MALKWEMYHRKPHKRSRGVDECMRVPCSICRLLPLFPSFPTFMRTHSIKPSPPLARRTREGASRRVRFCSCHVHDIFLFPSVQFQQLSARSLGRSAFPTKNVPNGRKRGRVVGWRTDGMERWFDPEATGMLGLGYSIHDTKAEIYPVLLVGYVLFKRCKIVRNYEHNWQFFLQIKNTWIDFWLRQWRLQVQNVHFNLRK